MTPAERHVVYRALIRLALAVVHRRLSPARFRRLAVAVRSEFKESVEG